MFKAQGNKVTTLKRSNIEESAFSEMELSVFHGLQAIGFERGTRVIAAAFCDETEVGLSTVGAEDQHFPDANDALVDDRFDNIEKRVGRSVTLAEASSWLGFTEEAILLRIKKRNWVATFGPN